MFYELVSCSTGAPALDASCKESVLGVVAVVGSGFSGAVVAHCLASAGQECHVFEARHHVGGNCHTERDEETGILVHSCGPHIFHTNSDRVWEFVQKFDTFVPFVNRVKAVHKNRVYSLPINLMTINNFFGKNMSPREAEKFIASLGDSSLDEPKTFEEQALKYVGRDLYEAFFKGYTEKQWGLDPSELPASILKRLPVRFNYDDNYYCSKYQGMPAHGYSHIISKLLDQPLISIFLREPFHRSLAPKYEHVFYSGPLDAWFDYSEGRLAYRTLDFEREVHVGDFQGTAVINYTDRDIPYTRIAEHKHFSPLEDHDKTVIFKEYSRSCGPSDIPYYPVRLVRDKVTLRAYVLKAQQEGRVTFLGRLGTYRYLDMDVTIEEALEVSRTFLSCRERLSPMPAFVSSPL
jgi:UDP-galactopyranose mutase